MILAQAGAPSFWVMILLLIHGLLPLIIIALLVSMTVVLASGESGRRHTKWMLVTEVLAIMVFCSLDLFFFFFAEKASMLRQLTLWL